MKLGEPKDAAKTDAKDATKPRRPQDGRRERHDQAGRTGEGRSVLARPDHAAREELRRNEVFADALQSRINALTTDFAAATIPSQRAQIAATARRRSPSSTA